MREIGSKTGDPTATVYQYFLDKETILATLYSEYVETTRTILDNATTSIGDAADAIFAAEQIIDAYYQVMLRTPSALHIFNAIKASKRLGRMDVAETRRQVKSFFDATEPFVPLDIRENYKTTLLLLFNMADATVRVALMVPQSKSGPIIEEFKRIVRAQAGQFLK